LFFVDARDYLAGIDVTCRGGNHAPVPDDIQIGAVVYRSRDAVEQKEGRALARPHWAG